MTWGQIRFQLLQSTPGLSLDLLDAWLNSRYEQVLESGDWTGIHARSILETTAAYQSATDSVTLTVGSTAVVGSGTAWTRAATQGFKFYRPGDTALYTVTAWTDATHFTLDRPYEGNGVDATGTVYAGAEYVLMQNVYALPPDCRSVERILDPVTGYRLAQLTPGELDAAAGTRTLIDDPQSFAAIEDQPESIGYSPQHQVELYPPPRLARGFTVEYVRAPYGFDGTNQTASPLPFVSQSVLLFGVRADIATHLGKLPQAAAYEAKFQEELLRLLRIEHTQRRAKPTLHMADRFTRHRMARSGRGFNNAWGPGAGGPY
jgi:hypothetical protein